VIRKRVIIIREEYSASNIQLNHIPEYSVINPATNSLSDSIRSKGILLLSIRIHIHRRRKSNIDREEIP
jgi:hypothetical protein